MTVQHKDQEQLQHEQMLARHGVRAALEEAIDALQGDSNDAEHEALWSLTDAVQDLLHAHGMWNKVEIKSYDDLLDEEYDA